MQVSLLNQVAYTVCRGYPFYFSIFEFSYKDGQPTGTNLYRDDPWKVGLEIRHVYKT